MEKNLKKMPSLLAFFAKGQTIYAINNNIYENDNCKILALSQSTKKDEETGQIVPIIVNNTPTNERVEYVCPTAMKYDIQGGDSYYLDSLIQVGDVATGSGNTMVASKTIHGAEDKTKSLKDYFSDLCVSTLEDSILKNYDKSIGEDESYYKLIKHEYIESGETKYSGVSETKMDKLGVPVWFIKQSSGITSPSATAETDTKGVKVCTEGIDFSLEYYKEHLAMAIKNDVLKVANKELSKYSDDVIKDYTLKGN